MQNVTAAQKFEMVVALKETEEWNTFIQHAEKIAIAHLTDKCGDKWYVEAGQIIADIISQCSQEAIDAFNNSSAIPAEFKAASNEDKVQFAIEVLVQQGTLISGIFLPKTPATEAPQA